MKGIQASLDEMKGLALGATGRPRGAAGDYIAPFGTPAAYNASPIPSDPDVWPAPPPPTERAARRTAGGKGRKLSQTQTQMGGRGGASQAQVRKSASQASGLDGKGPKRSNSLGNAKKRDAAAKQDSKEGEGSEGGGPEAFEGAGYDRDLVETIERDIVCREPNVCWFAPTHFLCSLPHPPVLVQEGYCGPHGCQEAPPGSRHSPTPHAGLLYGPTFPSSVQPAGRPF